MSVITKAVPKALLTGIRDESRRALVPEPEQLPQHLPLLPLLTERGPEVPQLVIGDSFSRLYGIDSLNPRSRYFNHQSKLASIIMGNANQVFVKRIKPSGAATALLRLSVDVLCVKIKRRMRNADGTFQINAAGKPIYQRANGAAVAFDNDPESITYGEPVNDSNVVSDANIALVDGYRLVWKKNVNTNTENFGAALNATGLTPPPSMITSVSGTPVYADNKMVRYPIMDLQVSSFGEWGNNVGLRLSAPTTDDYTPGDTATMKSVKAFLYRLMCVEKAKLTNTATITETNGGDLSIDLAFKRNVVNPITNQVLSINETFIDHWQDITSPNVPPKYGPFSQIKVYEDNIDTLLNLLVNGETAADHHIRTATDDLSLTNTDFVTTTIPGEKEWDSGNAYDGDNFGRTSDLAFSNSANLHLLNPFTAIDLNGVPFETVDVKTSGVSGAISFSENTTHYAVGGNDGLANANNPNAKVIDLQEYDALVGAYFLAFGNDSTVPLLDEAKYPISAVWDSGFSINTKKALLTPISRRKDIYTVLSPQAIAEYQDPNVAYNALTNPFNYVTASNNVSTENSIAVALKNYAALFPESVIDGTAACRAIIIGQTGKLIDGSIPDTLPLTLDFADKVSKYMGAGNGRWVSEFSFDESPRNQVSLFRNVSLPWKSEVNYTKDWDAGLCWAQNYDHQSMFFPAYQTVYPDDTSVLNTFMTMAACVELEHVVQRCWRDLTGGSKLTREQFIDRSNQLIVERTRDRFDARYVIIPETFFTEADSARGYSWSCKVHIYANNMMTVGTFTIVAHRMEDLAA
jgi:hypothetical protein